MLKRAFTRLWALFKQNRRFCRISGALRPVLPTHRRKIGSFSGISPLFTAPPPVLHKTAAKARFLTRNARFSITTDRVRASPPKTARIRAVFVAQQFLRIAKATAFKRPLRQPLRPDRHQSAHNSRYGTFAQRSAPLPTPHSEKQPPLGIPALQQSGTLASRHFGVHAPTPPTASSVAAFRRTATAFARSFRYIFNKLFENGRPACQPRLALLCFCVFVSLL